MIFGCKNMDFSILIRAMVTQVIKNRVIAIPFWFIIRPL
ncbi:hypothetical protein DJ66_1190 [Candidatus Liberibacter solanacearum]|uniref:Uncharacterized protein n=1 Tax=Candidatus Liberibacter solanacearum TaxID=556287 RepID=A0A0F4VIN8_9HYPH|nr:hypothetical protein DJ66_1190 [Candidatus Liberibacter solanacearum]